MSDSFVIHEHARRPPEPKRRKVLVTGAAGRIGSYLARHSAEKYDLTLVEHPDVDASAVEPYGEVVHAALGDLDRLKALFAGQDTIVHLAANPSPEATWDSVQRDNITGTYNAFVAADACDCRRVVYASSIHAVSGYPLDRQVQPDDPVNPGDLYGVSKCFGEAMARFMAVQHGLSSIAIRIGAFQPAERAEREDSLSMINLFVSDRDLHQLIERCVDDKDLLFAIVHGASRNLFNRMSIAEARELVGYEPVDDLSEENPRLRKLRLSRKLHPHSERGGQRSGVREEL